MALRAWHFAVVLGIIAAAAVILWLMGRLPICECGFVKPWHGQTTDSQNSQHFADWYSVTHVTHGLLFYFGLWLFARRLPLGARFVLAIALEAAWEVGENTDVIIERYRQATVSFAYFGDSIVNAVGDMIFTVAGFLLAAVLPVRAAVVLLILLEALCAYVVRDNLILNVIMLIAPVEAIRDWQAGAKPAG